MLSVWSQILVVVVKTKTAPLPRLPVALAEVVVAEELEPAEMLVAHPLWLAQVALVAHRLGLLLELVQRAVSLTTRIPEAMVQFASLGNVHHPLQVHHLTASPRADGLAHEPR